jgi:hypothetical protein
VGLEDSKEDGVVMLIFEKKVYKEGTNRVVAIVQQIVDYEGALRTRIIRRE